MNYYRLASPKITRACDLMREVLLAQLAEHGWLASATTPSWRRGTQAGTR